MMIYPRPHDVAPGIEGARVILAIKNFSKVPGVCIAENQWIATQHGYRKIQHVEVGSKIWTPWGLREVKIKVCNGIRETVFVRTFMGLTTQCTPDHAFLTLKHGDLQAQDLKGGLSLITVPWSGGDHIARLPAFEFKTGRSEEHSRWAHPETTPLIPEFVNADIAWLFGYFAGDGSVHERTPTYGGKVRFTVAKHEAYFLDKRIRDIVEKEFGMWREPTHDSNGGKGAFNLAFNSSSWADWLIALNPKHSVPDFIMESSEEIRCAYARGFFDADGCATSHGFRASNQSLSLLRDVQLLLLSAGVESKILAGNQSLDLSILGVHSESAFS